jgi:hypothetical protein
MTGRFFMAVSHEKTPSRPWRACTDRFSFSGSEPDTGRRTAQKNIRHFSRYRLHFN